MVDVVDKHLHMFAFVVSKSLDDPIKESSLDEVVDPVKAFDCLASECVSAVEALGFTGDAEEPSDVEIADVNFTICRAVSVSN